MPPPAKPNPFATGSHGMPDVPDLADHPALPDDSIRLSLNSFKLKVLS